MYLMSHEFEITDPVYESAYINEEIRCQVSDLLGGFENLAQETGNGLQVLRNLSFRQNLSSELIVNILIETDDSQVLKHLYYRQNLFEQQAIYIVKTLDQSV